MGNIVLAIQALQNLDTWTPQRVYWTYVWSRAQQLGLHASGNDGLALARLMCLNRIGSRKQLQELEDAWGDLCDDDRRVLINHFLADGITQKAIIFTYLQ